MTLKCLQGQLVQTNSLWNPPAVQTIALAGQTAATWATLLHLCDKNILTAENGHHDEQTGPGGHRFYYPVGEGGRSAEDWIDLAQVRKGWPSVV